MEIVPEDVIWSEFRKKYEEKPKGWRIHSGLSPKGFPELLISGPKESWLMKRESLYSGKLGVGGRIPEGIKLNSKNESFGLRDLPINKIQRIMNTSNALDVNKMMANLMNTSPIPHQNITSPVALEGPVFHSPKPLNLVSRKHNALDKLLDLEMSKWRSKISYLK